ncbi:MAG: Abi family protein [Firmicutes bacterium]|nr:Abi family protein [Bacillota bacterium]
MKRLIIGSGEEKNDSEFYIRVKGVAIHQKIMTHLGVDFSRADSTVEWSKVSALLRYDKKLRDKIYIYLATLEEYLRAYLSNKYESIPNQSFWHDGRKQRSKVKTRILQGEHISDVLQSLEFGDLMIQIKNLPPIYIKEIFESTDEIQLNLDAVRELRNAVSHHAFLIGYEFKLCNVCEDRSNSLKNNIKNLRQLLPKEYRFGKNGKGGITGEIENCKYDFEFDDQGKRVKRLMLLESKDMISII